MLLSRAPAGGILQLQDRLRNTTAARSAYGSLVDHHRDGTLVLHAAAAIGFFQDVSPTSRSGGSEKRSRGLRAARSTGSRRDDLAP